LQLPTVVKVTLFSSISEKIAGHCRRVALVSFDLFLLSCLTPLAFGASFNSRDVQSSTCSTVFPEKSDSTVDLRMHPRRDTFTVSDFLDFSDIFSVCYRSLEINSN
jgi:hypothetical protein